MFKEFRRITTVDRILRILYPFLKDDLFLRHNPDVVAFQVEVNQKTAKECANELANIGFTDVFYEGVTKVVFQHEGGAVIKVPIIEDFVPFVVEEVDQLNRLERKWQRHFAHMEFLSASQGVIFQTGAPCNSELYKLQTPKIAKVVGALELHDIHENNVGFDNKEKFLIIDAQPKVSIDRIRSWKPGGKIQPWTPGPNQTWRDEPY